MDLKISILRKLFRHRYIGEKHTSIDNLGKGLPKHLRGAAKKAVKELIKKGFLLTKPTSYGLEVSLNPNRINEIIDLIKPQ